MFLWGALGASAPEVVRWFRIAKVGTPGEWRRLSYWFATLAYVALGGLLALLVAKPDAYAAFMAGLTTEFAIAGALKMASTEAQVPAPPGSLPEELTLRPAGPTTVVAAVVLRHASFLGRRA